MTRRLDVQYRMNEAIMAFPSNEFYRGELTADSTVRGHRLFAPDDLDWDEEVRIAIEGPALGTAALAQ